MIIPFTQDIFSQSTPSWSSSLSTISEDLLNVVSRIDNNVDKDDIRVEYSGAFEVNSSNFKIRIDGKTYLLKRWSSKLSNQRVENLTGLMSWLGKSGVKVPEPELFMDGSRTVSIKDTNWSYFEFKEGEYFSGAPNQLLPTAEATGHLASKLSALPIQYRPPEGPDYFTDHQSAILKQFISEKKSWQRLLGKPLVDLIAPSIPLVERTWGDLKNKYFDLGDTCAVHFDLHPHNLIMTNGDVESILDFESCLWMPFRIGCSFSMMKQLRQSIAFQNGNRDIKKTVNSYMKSFIAQMEIEQTVFGSFKDLALFEVLRRLVLILELNLVHEDKTWNNVLPIQIRNLYESPILFK